MEKKLKILIADDHMLVAAGVKEIIQAKTEHSVVSIVENGKEVLNYLEQQLVDLILMDINMPQMNGIQCTKKVKEIYPGVKVIVLTMYNRKQFVRELMDAGVDGCILKSNSGKELIVAIDRVMEGKNYYDHIHEFENVVDRMESFKLSDREIEIIALISEGLTSKEIASRLFISEHTVKTHRKNIFRKLKVKGADELIQFAMNNGLT